MRDEPVVITDLFEALEAWCSETVRRNLFYHDAIFLSDASCSPIDTALPPCGHEQCKGLGCKAGFSQMDTGLSQPACLWYLHGAVFSFRPIYIYKALIFIMRL